ncbi:MAG: amidohydrolase family protein [Gammaproteobacteria bacterium]|nr:amidohydrolase family protein [Gammaproteobacteria bacterium]
MTQRTLITAPRLFDGHTTSSQRYVIVEDNVIADVGAIADLGANAADTFDQTLALDADTTLLPGLINMHTHVSFSSSGDVFGDQIAESDATKMIRVVENLHAALDVGITTIRDCGTWPHLAIPARDAIEQGLLRGPRMITSGAITTTGGHCWFCATEADSEAEIRKAVRAHVKDGVDFIKLFATGGNTTPGSNSLVAQYTGDEMCAATEEARKAGRRSAAHAHAIDGVRNSIKARVTTIEHCSFQSSDGIGWDQDMVSEIVDAGIFVCPTIFRGFAKIAADPAYVLNAAEQAYMARREQRFHLTHQLAERGVKLVSGNDAGVGHCHITDFPGDLVETVTKCDMSPVAVLKSATSVAAEALGRGDIGVIDKAHAADLLVVQGDVTQDIRAIEQPQIIMARGRVQRMDALHH